MCGIAGWIGNIPDPEHHAIRMMKMLEFAAAHDVRPQIEVMPMDNLNRAIESVRDNQPRYRMVLEV